MTWQEYEEAVAILYEQLEGLGSVKRNTYLPDKITGGKRQIDVLIEIEERGHKLLIVVDAKFYAKPLDVKVLESVLAESSSVRANKTIIVAANGWTKQAEIKAQHELCDLRILSLEDALDLLVPDKWMMCPVCKKDCIVLDQPGAIELPNGSWLWWLAGQCRECKMAEIHCQECGSIMNLMPDENGKCQCGYTWFCNEAGTCLDIQEGFGL